MIKRHEELVMCVLFIILSQHHYADRTVTPVDISRALPSGSMSVRLGDAR